MFSGYVIGCTVDVVTRPCAGRLRNWSQIPDRGKKFVSPLKLPACLQSQAKASQAKPQFLGRRTSRGASTRPSVCLAIPASDRIAGLSNKHRIQGDWEVSRH